LLLHGVGTAVPWAIVSSSIICGSFGTDTNSRHVVVRNAAGTEIIGSIVRSGTTVSTQYGITLFTTFNEVRLTLVNAGSAISSSGAYSTVSDTLSAGGCCGSKEAGHAGLAGGSSSIDLAVRDILTACHGGISTTCRSINVSSVLDEAVVSGDLTLVIVELKGLGGGFLSGSYIN